MHEYEAIATKVINERDQYLLINYLDYQLKRSHYSTNAS